MNNNTTSLNAGIPFFFFIFYYNIITHYNDLPVGGVRVIAELRDVSHKRPEVCHATRFIRMVCLGDHRGGNAKNVHGDRNSREFPRPETPLITGEKIVLDRMVEVSVRH